MKRYRYFLGGNLLADDPIGWDELKQKFQRIKEFNALLLKIDVTLSFYGDGFTHLINKRNTDGFYATEDLEIQELNNDQQTYRIVHQGIIKLSEIEIDRQQMLVKAPILDNSFYARINNNKNIAAFPYVDRSKNDVAITACPLSFVHYVMPSDCSINSILLTPPYTSAHFRVFDLFEYLISFMTDGRVDFQSTLFDTGGDYAGLMVTCGKVIREVITGTTEAGFKNNFQKISFQKLFSEVNKILNIGMRVSIISGRPTIIIEEESFFRQDTILHICSDIEHVTETIDVTQLYAKVKLGSDKIDTASSLSFPEGTTFLGFKEEEFVVLGECNLDTELDLVNNFILSSNVIEDCLINGATTYDKDFFFVMTDPYYYFWITRTGNVFGDPSPCQFNLDFTNDKKVNNWLGGIPNSLVQYLGSPVDARFRAGDTFGVATTVLPLNTVNTIEPFAFNNDTTPPNFDTSGTFSLDKFTCPSVGTYNFFSKIFVQFIPNPFLPTTVQVTVGFRRYDAANVLLEERIFFDQVVNAFNTVNYNFSGTRYFFLNPTDYVDVFITFSTNPSFGLYYNIPTGSYFECTGSASSGGVYGNIDPDDALIVNHSYDKDLTSDEFDNILADPRGLIKGTTHNNYIFRGWIDELTFDRVKGSAKWKLFSSRNT